MTAIDLIDMGSLVKAAASGLDEMRSGSRSFERSQLGLGSLLPHATSKRLGRSAHDLRAASTKFEPVTDLLQGLSGDPHAVGDRLGRLIDGQASVIESSLTAGDTTGSAASRRHTTRELARLRADGERAYANVLGLHRQGGLDAARSGNKLLAGSEWETVPGDELVLRAAVREAADAVALLQRGEHRSGTARDIYVDQGIARYESAKRLGSPFVGRFSGPLPDDLFRSIDAGGPIAESTSAARRLYDELRGVRSDKEGVARLSSHEQVVQWDLRLRAADRAIAEFIDTGDSVVARERMLSLVDDLRGSMHPNLYAAWESWNAIKSDSIAASAVEIRAAKRLLQALRLHGTPQVLAGLPDSELQQISHNLSLESLNNAIQVMANGAKGSHHIGPTVDNEVAGLGLAFVNGAAPQRVAQASREMLNLFDVPLSKRSNVWWQEFERATVLLRDELQSVGPHASTVQPGEPLQMGVRADMVSRAREFMQRTAIGEERLLNLAVSRTNSAVEGLGGNVNPALTQAQREWTALTTHVTLQNAANVELYAGSLQRLESALRLPPPADDAARTLALAQVVDDAGPRLLQSMREAVSHGDSQVAAAGGASFRALLDSVGDNLPAELRATVDEFKSSQEKVTAMAAIIPPVFAVDRPGLARRGLYVEQAQQLALAETIVDALRQQYSVLSGGGAAAAAGRATGLQHGIRDAASAVDLLRQASDATGSTRYDLSDRAVAAYAVASVRARTYLEGAVNGVETIDQLVGLNGAHNWTGYDDAIEAAAMLHDRLKLAAANVAGKGGRALTAKGPAIDLARTVLPRRSTELRAIGTHALAFEARSAELHLQAAVAVIEPVRGYLPSAQQADLELVRELTEGGIALRSGSAVTDAADALDRIAGALTDSLVANAAKLPWPQHHAQQLASAIGHLDDALSAWEPAAEIAFAAGEDATRGQFTKAIHGFGDVEYALLQARSSLHATMSPDDYSIFQRIRRDLARATLHMQTVDDAVGVVGTSAWPKLGELGKSKADLQFVRDAAAQRLADSNDAVKFAGDWAGSTTAEPLTAAAADAASAYVPDLALPAHQVHANDVDEYLRHSIFDEPVIHGTGSVDSVTSIVTMGPDARKNTTAAYGTGIYATFDGGLGYSNEVKLAINSGRIAEFNGNEAFRAFMARALLGKATSYATMRRAFLDRGYEGVVIKNADNKGKAFIVMYDLRDIRVVVP